MSQENVEIVMEAHAAVGRRDLDGFLLVWHPEAEYRAAVTQVVEGEGGVFRGHDGMRRWWSDLDDLFDDLRTEVREVQDLGEAVLVVFVTHGRGKHSGLTIAEPLAQILTVREGKIIQARDYRSRAEALKAVGLSE